VIYEVEINGRTRRVEIERTATGCVAIVDGQRHAVDVTPVDGALSLILDDAPAAGDRPSGSVSPGRRSYEVSVAEDPPGSGTVAVHVNGRVVSARVGASRGSWGRRAQDGGGGGEGPHAVSAPMPGKVVKVLVKTGEKVTARQGVVVVEAMKMENELRSPKAGTVAEVKVTEGTSVDAGAVLVVIE